MKLCSACLLGMNCRYDGKGKINQKIVDLAAKEILIPICPEQLGGLPTPRKPAEIVNGKVLSEDGEDFTTNFISGAKQVLELAEMYNIKSAILKQRSPSCGCGQIYDGTFTGKIIKGNGITAKILKENGIEVISEEDL